MLSSTRTGGGGAISIPWCAGRNRHGWFPRSACPLSLPKSLPRTRYGGEGDSPSAARHRVARLCRGGFETRPSPVRRGKPGNPTVVGTKIAARRPIRHSGARRIPAPQEPSPIQSPAAAVSSRWRWRSYFIPWCAGRNRHGWFPRSACPLSLPKSLPRTRYGGEGDSPSAARHRVARLCRGGFETRPPPPCDAGSQETPPSLVRK